MKLKLLPSTIPFHSFQLRDFNFNASSSSSVQRPKHRFNFIVTCKSKKKHKNNDAKGSDSQQTPPRITSNAKQNLQVLKTLKECQKRKTSTPRPSTSYRKKKAEKAPIPIDKDSGTSDTNKKLILKESDPPVMLVDGYNVCGYWTKLKTHFMSGELETARQLLINELISFSMHREFKVVVVFDAMMSGFRTHKKRAAGIDIVFSGERTADTWISFKVSALKKDGCPEVWVVTSDRSQQEEVSFAGANVWSCKTLVDEIEELQKEADEMRLAKRYTSFQASVLKNPFDKKVVDALKTLRQQLSKKQSK